MACRRPGKYKGDDIKVPKTKNKALGGLDIEHLRKGGTGVRYLGRLRTADKKATSIECNAMSRLWADGVSLDQRGGLQLRLRPAWAHIIGCSLSKHTVHE